MKLKRTVCSAITALMLSTSGYADCAYELFSITSNKETKIIDFVEQLSDQCEYSIIITDSNAQEFLESKLNKTHFKNLTINEVLDIVLGENNLSYSLENNILKISYLTTRVFGIDYILSQRKGSGSTDITLTSSSGQEMQSDMTQMMTGTSSGEGDDNSMMDQMAAAMLPSSSKSGIKIETNDEVVFWNELDLEFQRVLNRPEDNYEAQAPIINKNAGLVTVTATNKQMKRFESYLNKLQNKVQLQVLIDVQLLAVTMSDAKSTGIDWKQLYALQNVSLGIDNIKAKNVTEFEDGSITEGAYNMAQDTFRFFQIKGTADLQEVVKFLKTQGDVNSISNPKVLTLNNQPALITAGTEYFYKIEQSIQQQGTGGGVAATSQNEEIKSVFAGVLLSITPEIADDNTITLIINPSLSETTRDLAQDDAENRTMPPDLNRRQLSSVVTVKDGNRIILGGLINTKNTQEESQVPLLGSIPGLSYLFSYEETIKQTEELVIVIEPHIIRKENNKLSLSDLGYEGLSNSILEKQDSSKEEVKENGENEI